MKYAIHTWIGLFQSVSTFWPIRKLNNSFALFRDFSQLCSKIPKIQGGIYLPTFPTNFELLHIQKSNLIPTNHSSWLSSWLPTKSTTYLLPDGLPTYLLRVYLPTYWGPTYLINDRVVTEPYSNRWKVFKILGQSNEQLNSSSNEKWT